MASDSQTALDILSLMILEDGSRWGQTAADFQIRNATAILGTGDGQPQQHWLEMPRGARKTTDVAGIILAALYAQAPTSARVYVGASDEDQARELVDAAQGLIDRTPELEGIFRVTELVITCVKTGAAVIALAADASAMGKRAWLIILDEVANWPDTRKARKFWGVLMSGNRKLAACRTVVITNAGDPAHWAWKRRETARTSPYWRFCAVPGPLPWLTETDLAILMENAEVYSEYERLHLNKWSTAEDRLATREDIEACTTLSGPQAPVPGRRYVVTLDVGIVNDRTVVAVMHAEQQPSALPRIALDAIARWQGSKASPVPLDEVREHIAAVSRQYNGAELAADPHEAVDMIQALRRQGVTASEFTFSATSVGRLALSLHQVIRQRRLDLPPDEDLADELVSVRLRKNSLGVYRLDHDSGAHDDQAVAIALGCHWLLDAPAEPSFPILGPVPGPSGVTALGTEVMRPMGNWAVRIDPAGAWASDGDDRAPVASVQRSPFG